MATPKRVVLQLLSVAAVLLSPVMAYNDNLVQTYCSNQNTGQYYAGETNNYESLGSCETQCQNDFAFAVVKGTTCWCSNYAPSNQLPVSQCSQTCPGFPYEDCGSTAGNLYGYLQLSRAAWGTWSTTATTIISTRISTEVSTAVTTAPAIPTTVILTSDHTVISTEVNTVSASPSTAILSVTVVQTLTATEAVTIIPAASSPSSSSTLTSTYVSRVTVSGAVITQYITTVATLGAESSSPAVPIQRVSSHGLSSGATAGVVVGAILGAALLFGFLFFFCCWRPRHQSQDENGEKGLNRNTSVLSKAGLLRRFSQRDTPSGGSAKVPPRLQTTVSNNTEDPRSAITMGSAAAMSTTSNSRPVFVDQRLNPNWAAGHHPNTSTSTLGSLRDYRDYSRPLEVRNPDPH